MELLTAPFAAWLAAAPRLIGPYYPYLNATHILSLALLVGAITTLDLRLLGVFSRFSAAQLAPPLTRMAGIGLAGALLTGVLLFSVQPTFYAANSAFRLKLLLLVAAIINVVVVRRLPSWRALRDGASIAPVLRLTAALSLTLWICVLFAGRWVAFV